MPCTDSGLADYKAEQRRRLDQTTRLLCEAYRVIWDKGIEGEVSAEGHHWKHLHDEEDRQRKEAERQRRVAQQRDRFTLARQALARLTPSERELVMGQGFDDD